jgi:hypothetical protein
MERAAETGAAVSQAAQMRGAAALEAVGSLGGRTHRLGLEDDLCWGKPPGRQRRPSNHWPPSQAARAARSRCAFVPPLGRTGGGGHARP